MNFPILLRPMFLLGLAIASMLSVGCHSLTKKMSPDSERATPDAGGNRFSVESDSASTNQVQMEEWWAVYEDETLDLLMEQLHENNPNLDAAAARVEKSLAALGVTGSQRFHVISASGAIGRQRDSINNLLFPISQPEYSRYRLGLNASWEIDLWGRVAGMTEGARREAEATAADYEGVMLSLQIQLATQYFNLLHLTNELNQRETIRDLASEELGIQKARVRHGLGVGSDVDAAMLQFKEADAVVKVGERGVARLHNSIAVLTGFIPTDGDPIDLSVDRMKSLPKIPVGVPSKLLIRRPDLKASDRRMQASAIQVGVRKADYLPRIMLVGSGGVASLKTSNLFEGNSGLFSVGPEVDVPLFRLGARKSAVAQAKAEWKESVAMMQSLFLTSVQEVEDALVEAKSLSEELIVRQEAARSASSSANDAHRRYEVGLGAKSEWLAAQVTAKQQGILVQQVRNESVLAQLRLIQALGGIWE